MKFEFNKKYNTIAVYAIIVIIIAILMVVSVFKFGDLLSVIMKVLEILTPIITGFAIAYILNPIMKFFEKKAFSRLLERKKKRKRLVRGLSLFTTFLLTLSVLTAAILIVMPQLIVSISEIIKNVPAYLTELNNWALKTLDSNPELYKFVNEGLNELNLAVSDIVSIAQPQVTNLLGNITAWVWSVVIALKNVLIGLIIAVYLLYSKEMFIAQFKKIMFAFIDNDKCLRIFKLYHRSNEIFIGSIMGKFIDSFIIGVMCYFGMLILNLPHPSLIGVIIGVTNIIPYFGPFIGAIPCALLIFMTSPIQSLWFALFILILQQFDGNILGPYILGDSTGLPAFWALFSILVGGGLFGVMGMVLGIPVFGVIYMILRIFVESKLAHKKMPTSTNEYSGNVNYMTSDYVYQPPKNQPVVKVKKKLINFNFFAKKDK